MRLSCADAVAQGVQPEQIIFTDVAMKNEHIRRSALADLFLDTLVIIFISMMISYWFILIASFVWFLTLWYSCSGLCAMHIPQELTSYGLVYRWLPCLSRKWLLGLLGLSALQLDWETKWLLAGDYFIIVQLVSLLKSLNVLETFCSLVMERLDVTKRVSRRKGCFYFFHLFNLHHYTVGLWMFCMRSITFNCLKITNYN